MLYITGDTHGTLDIDKLTALKDMDMTKDDYLIILGDVGFGWYNDFDKPSSRDRYTIERVKDLTPGQILFIDGNHENFNFLDSLPVVDMFGGKVQVIKDCIHLMRGEVYEIDGKKVFTFGGGNSIDKAGRVENLSWWRREMPSKEEYDRGIDNLEKCGYKVDYIFTHTAPDHICNRLVSDMYEGEEPLQRYLSHIQSITDCKEWFFGHWHMDVHLRNTIPIFHAVYDGIIRR